MQILHAWGRVTGFQSSMPAWSIIRKAYGQAVRIRRRVPESAVYLREAWPDVRAWKGCFSGAHKKGHSFE
ncbi:hypothetical protein BKM14_00605 [Pseudomonas syringae pv. syringae]|nr:hypothetical protein BKM14_00605 [Pseudomonas syringae pv. syringae]POD52967.1 hypothetical protein BKM15_13900 [Pseudomonas syringae pv. syringae]